MTKVKLITNPEEYFDMLTADEIVVTDVSFVSDNITELPYENKENFIELNAKTNVVIAVFTTAHAQLKLYSTQCRINHMTEVAYATGPALLGGPALCSVSIF